jgi:hypothetical protein
MQKNIFDIAINLFIVSQITIEIFLEETRKIISKIKWSQTSSHDVGEVFMEILHQDMATSGMLEDN